MPGGGAGALAGPLGPGRPQLLALVFVLDRGGGVVVQSLGHEVQRQAILNARGFLDLGALVLEPDLDLGLVETELLGQGLPPLLRDVAVRLELRLESLQLLGSERRPRSLVLLLVLLLLQLPGARTCSGEGRVGVGTEGRGEGGRGQRKRENGSAEPTWAPSFRGDRGGPTGPGSLLSANPGIREPWVGHWDLQFPYRKWAKKCCRKTGQGCMCTPHANSDLES